MAKTKGSRDVHLTDKDRDTVRRLKALNWSHNDVARYLGISTRTLETKCPYELKHGAQEKRAELFAIAERLAKRGNTAMIKWVMSQYFGEGSVTSEPTKPAAQKQAREKKPRLGKKETRQIEAAKVDGKFAPPPPPKGTLLN